MNSLHRSPYIKDVMSGHSSAANGLVTGSVTLRRKDRGFVILPSMHVPATGSVFLGALLTVFTASSQRVSSSGDAVRRFSYPPENFSIALPASWGEIDSAT